MSYKKTPTTPKRKSFFDGLFQDEAKPSDKKTEVEAIYADALNEEKTLARRFRLKVKADGPEQFDDDKFSSAVSAVEKCIEADKRDDLERAKNKREARIPGYIQGLRDGEYASFEDLYAEVFGVKLNCTKKSTPTPTPKPATPTPAEKAAAEAKAKAEAEAKKKAEAEAKAKAEAEAKKKAEAEKKAKEEAEKKAKEEAEKKAKAEAEAKAKAEAEAKKKAEAEKKAKEEAEKKAKAEAEKKAKAEAEAKAKAEAEKKATSAVKKEIILLSGKKTMANLYPSKKDPDKFLTWGTKDGVEVFDSQQDALYAAVYDGKQIASLTVQREIVEMPGFEIEVYKVVKP